jgi:hypothetical protein
LKCIRGNGQTINIVKSNHFSVRDEQRGIFGLQIAIEKALAVAVQLVEQWKASGKAQIEGVIKTADNMNIVFSVEPDKRGFKDVDFVFQTIIIKRDFVSKNPGDVVVTI